MLRALVADAARRLFTREKNRRQAGPARCVRAQYRLRISASGRAAAAPARPSHECPHATCRAPFADGRSGRQRFIGISCWCSQYRLPAESHSQARGRRFQCLYQPWCSARPLSDAHIALSRHDAARQRAARRHTREAGFFNASLRLRLDRDDAA